MQYNPYAAPDAGANAPQPGAPQGTGPQPWEIGEVLGAAWNAFTPNWATLVFSQFIGALLAGIPNYLPIILVFTHAVEQNSSEYWAIYVSCLAIGLAINAFFQAGLVKIWIDAARGQQTQFGDLFGGGSHYFAMLACNILTMFVVIVGCGIFIVPGVILALGLGFSQFYAVDQNMGPIQAMQASWAATTGQKGSMLLFGLVCFLLILAGYVACCVGVFIAIPIAAVAAATVYTRISGTTGQPTAADAPPVGYGPPPGYGPPSA